MNPFALYRSVSLPALLALASLVVSETVDVPLNHDESPVASTSTAFEVPGTRMGGKFGLDNYDYCQATFPSKEDHPGKLDGYQLAHLQVIVRHGDRTAANVLSPNEDVEWNCDDVVELTHMDGDLADDGAGGGPHIDGYRPRPQVPNKKIYSKNVWRRGTCMLGQLTSKGIRQHVQLGKELRKIYVDRLGYLEKKLTRGDVEFEGIGRGVYVRSSHYRRTIQSAGALMTGLYPAKTTRDKGAKHIPIQFYSEETESYTPHLNGNCPRLNQVIDEIRATPKYQDFLNSHTALRTHIDEVAGTKDVPKFDKTYIPIFDALRTRTCHQKDLPSRGEKRITAENVDELNLAVSEETMLLRDATPEGKEYNRLTIGFFLGEMYDRMMNGMRQQVIEVNEQGDASSMSLPPRFELFSGHDDTVYGMLAILKAKDARWPPYASNLIFELWRKQDGSHEKPEDHMLRVLYNGKLLQTDLCDMSACPLPRFIEKANEFIVRNTTTDCTLH